MEYKNLSLNSSEKAVFDMRELFETYGYTQYKVSKFEEYDLYATNKKFLISDNILTFTDTTGKLMALKPDVTLSIVKNSKADKNAIQKVYYCENVYRTQSGSQGFKEIMQTGLECIGDVDLYSMSEVLMLAAKSLEKISESYILDISHMGFMSGLLDCGIEPQDQKRILKLIGMKNVPEIVSLCDELAIPERIKEAVCKMTTLYLPLEESVEAMKEYVTNRKMASAVSELEAVLNVMKLYGIDKKLYVDLSMVNDMNYYSGIIFQGFIEGIPDGVLSGGRYDNLLQKIGKNTGAIGFAVYLDKLEMLIKSGREYDVDTLVVYGDDVSAEAVVNAVLSLTKEGKSSRAVKAVPEDVKYRELMML